MPLTIYIDGEPAPHANMDDFDLGILSGGSNQHAQAVYLPVLPLEKWSSHDFHQVPAQEDHHRPIDVLYRSSNCTPQREALATKLRQAVEAQGLRFVATGACTAGGERDMQWEQHTGWGECKECTEAKMIVAFENFTEGQDYLSEKPFLGWRHGSVPLYKGNGQRLMRQIGINQAAMVDADAFADDEAFVARVVELAQQPDQLAPLQSTAPLLPDHDLHSLAALQKVAHERQLPQLPSDAAVYIDNAKTPRWEEMARALGATNFRQVTQEQEADVVITSCCGWNRSD